MDELRGGGAGSGVTAAYPVPEPAEWAMLLGGLAVIGMVAAHRRPA